MSAFTPTHYHGSRNPENVIPEHERQRMAAGLRRGHLVAPSDLRATVAACKSCGKQTASVDFPLTREQSTDSRYLSADFTGLPPELAEPLMAVDATGRRAPTCPRCRLLAFAPWRTLAYSNIQARYAGGHHGMRAAAMERTNVPTDEFPTPAGGLDLGQIAITRRADQALFRPPFPGFDYSPTDPTSIRPKARALLACHQGGDHGAVGFAADARTDGPSGLLADRLARNVEAVRSGRGDVVSCYDGGVTVWTALGQPTALSLVFVEADRRERPPAAGPETALDRARDWSRSAPCLAL